MKTNNNLWTDAKCAALQAEFLTTKEELKLYAINLYNAAVWGREVDKKNKAVWGRDKSVK